MPKMNIKVAHSLDEKKALQKIKTFLKKAKSTYSDSVSNIQETWEGNKGAFSFKAMGFPISGKITVQKKYVILTGTLPIAAMMFKKRIETTLRNHAEEILT